MAWSSGFRRGALWALVLVAMVGCGAPSEPPPPESGHFSHSYSEAREKFLAAARAAGATLEPYRNPFPGAQGEALYSDVALFGVEGAETLLILISGTHGVEGYAGSAIQVGLLRDGIADRLKPGVGLILYHALNPFGLSHLRRFNEQNVDLNRNFVDHSRGYRPNPGYDRLAAWIEPESLSTWSELKTRIAFAWFRLTSGELALRTAISQGQYNHPRGLFFGGHRESWSNRTLRSVISRHLSAARRVVVIDLHTGLGPFQGVEVISNGVVGSDAHRRAVAWWGERVKVPEAGESVSVPIQGPLQHAFEGIAERPIETTVVSLEFGTVPSAEAFWALRRENYRFHHADVAPAEQRAAAEALLRAFYPDSAAWRNTVWQEGRRVVDELLQRLQ